MTDTLITQLDPATQIDDSDLIVFVDVSDNSLHQDGSTKKISKVNFNANINLALGNKSDVGHTHAIGNIIGLQDALDNKADISGTVVLTDFSVVIKDPTKEYTEAISAAGITSTDTIMILHGEYADIDDNSRDCLDLLNAFSIAGNGFFTINLLFSTPTVGKINLKYRII